MGWPLNIIIIIIIIIIIVGLCFDGHSFFVCLSLSFLSLPPALFSPFLSLSSTGHPLRLPNLMEYLREPIQSGLGDRSAYVRKTAVMGIVKLFYVAPEFIAGMVVCERESMASY